MALLGGGFLTVARNALTATCLLVLLSGCETLPAVDEPVDSDTRKRAQLQTQLGIGYLREGQLEKAFSRLNTAVRTDPTHAPAHNALGLVYERLQQPDKAGAHYERATRLDPSLASARNNYGGWLCARERYDEAEEEFRQAASNPLYQVPQLALFNAGVCLQRKGDLERASRYFRASLDREPTFPQSLFAMAELSLTQNEHLSARAYLQRYLEVGTHSARSLWLGIRIERELGDKNALSSYEVLLRSKFPDSQETRLLAETSSK